MTKMHHPNYAHYLDCDCINASASLGIQNMPDGYSLMLDGERMCYFFFDHATGRESATHWDKWAVYRWARADSQRKKNPMTNKENK